MGAMAALAYLGRPVHDRPVEPHGLVLIAAAAGKLAERGLGRLLATPATGVLFGLVEHTPQHAIRALAAPTCAMLTSWLGCSAGERAALATTAAAALASTPATTAIGYLPSLRSYDQYQTLGSISARTIVISGGADWLTPPLMPATSSPVFPTPHTCTCPVPGTCCPSRPRTSSTTRSPGR